MIAITTAPFLSPLTLRGYLLQSFIYGSAGLTSAWRAIADKTGPTYLTICLKRCKRALKGIGSGVYRNISTDECEGRKCDAVEMTCYGQISTD